jgi:hypothetical protein
MPGKKEERRISPQHRARTAACAASTRLNRASLEGLLAVCDTSDKGWVHITTLVNIVEVQDLRVPVARVSKDGD